MEEYPEELRTPPVTLASLVGCPELHTLISTHLMSAQPPINTLALPDFSKIHLFNKKSTDSTDSTTATSPSPIVAGILKRDWLLKHRTFRCFSTGHPASPTRSRSCTTGVCNRFDPAISLFTDSMGKHSASTLVYARNPSSRRFVACREIG